MDDLTYDLLAWLERGQSVFRPREVAAGCEEPFPALVALLLRLRDQRLVAFLDGHVAKAESGTYLMVGPVQLTPAGKSALERDRSLGARPLRSGHVLPWRS